MPAPSETVRVRFEQELIEVKGSLPYFMKDWSGDLLVALERAQLASSLPEQTSRSLIKRLPGLEQAAIIGVSLPFPGQGFSTIYAIQELGSFCLRDGLCDLASRTGKPDQFVLTVAQDEACRFNAESRCSYQSMRQLSNLTAGLMLLYYCPGGDRLIKSMLREKTDFLFLVPSPCSPQSEMYGLAFLQWQVDEGIYRYYNRYDLNDDPLYPYNQYSVGSSIVVSDIREGKLPQISQS